jgi:hypothetical protein
MAREIRVRAVRRKEIDEDKLAVAFLLLAKILHEQEEAAKASGKDKSGREAA